MASRVYNFAAGPAMLPDPVLKKLQVDIYNWRGSGMGIMEMSHRSKEFSSIADESEDKLRRLLNISSSYEVLFLNDGATRQFSMVPRNLLGNKKSADYVQTGYWSQKAIDDAKVFMNPRIAGSTKDVNYVRLPVQDELNVDPNAPYLHYTANETIGGLEFSYVPNCSDIPLVTDMSSNFLSKPIDINRHGLIYASAQKNFGPSAFCIVIIRKDLVGHAPSGTAKLDDYAVHAREKSKYNTPNTLAWYTADLVFDWIKDQGGLQAIDERNRSKANYLYDFIDRSGFYTNPIKPAHRSRMNVPFNLNIPKEEDRLRLEKVFVEEAKGAGLLNLEGHRSIGGMRASIYNAVPKDGVEKLVEFMEEFEKRYA